MDSHHLAAGHRFQRLRGESEDRIGRPGGGPDLVKIEQVFRITSYNVCYTKLLRFLAGWQDRF